MKKILFTFALILSSSFLWAQTPQKISYQAVVRDSTNTVLTELPIGVKISILQGSETGTVVFSETHTPTTNTNGLFSVEIGGGTPDISTLASINWANGPYFVKTETDLSGGTNYSLTAVSQLLAVPYALHAHVADSVVGGISGGGSSNWTKTGSNLSYTLGNIGIGTANPFAKLEVYNNTSTGERQGISSFVLSPAGNTNYMIASKNQVMGSGTGIHVGVMGLGGRDLDYAGFAGNVFYGVYGGSTDTVSSRPFNTGTMGFASGNRNTNYGVDGTAGSSVGTNYGASGWAWGNTSGINYGVYGYATGSSTENYAVYGRIDNANTSIINYSGYFKGAPVAVENDNLYIKDFSKGVILKSPDGNCWQVKVSNTGTLTTTSITCPQ